MTELQDTVVEVYAEQQANFQATPNVETLLDLYRVLMDALEDHRLAAILDTIRPIQHRVTLIQADATPELLEALARDPHHHVRRVVAQHAAISDEVCFRLGEDSNVEVRLALRKNPHCHPLIRAALLAQEKGDLTLTELLIEMAWDGRRAAMMGDDLLVLIKEWTGLRELAIPYDMTVEQAHLVRDVLQAKLGKGSMPRKPRKKTASKATSSKPAPAKKKATKKKATKKKTTKKKATKKKK
jgi:hypothetical protein